MRKIVLTFGSIAGIVCVALFYARMPMDGQFDFEKHSQLYGYLTMFIALSAIFFAVKQYRDNYNNGSIKFGKAFLIGMLITLVAVVFYVVAWEIYFSKNGEAFVDQYLSYQEEQYVNSGMSTSEVQTKMAEDTELFESYETNVFVRMAFTAIEILPVGLLISLLASLLFGVVLKKKEVVPT